MILALDWAPDLGIKLGPITLRYYSLMFVLAFLLGYQLMKRMFQKEGKNLEHLDTFLTYTVFATIIGARLGECLFYNWDYYQNNILEIFLPFRANPNESILGIVNGYEWIGYQGLASHGATIALLIATYLVSKKIKESFWWCADRIALAIALGGSFVRFGNFMNSEIVGKKVDESFPFAVIFRKRGQFGEDFARHPSQLYESVSYFILFWILFYLYEKTNIKQKEGVLFCIFFSTLWLIRFCIEFTKIAQVDERATWALNTGQWLSIPFFIAGLWFLNNRMKNATKLV